MSRRPLHIVDVFAERPYAGNQLAVVLEATGLSGETMQQIAREMNFSETTFVTGRVDGGYRVRIFTPTDEIPFAGHPTLGTAWVVRERLISGAPKAVALDLGVGRVRVTFDGGGLVWLEAPRATMGAVHETAALAAVLGLSPEDVDDAFPVRQVDVGLAPIVVPLRGRAALARCRPDPGALAALRQGDVPPLVYAFCPTPESAAHDLAARCFFDAEGVREDPATGSATACLGAWLLAHPRCGPPPLALTIVQGAEMGRPSLLRLRAERRDGALLVMVGGRVVPTVEGVLV